MVCHWLLFIIYFFPKSGSIFRKAPLFHINEYLYTCLLYTSGTRLGVQQGIEALAYQIVLIPVDLSHTVQTDTQYQTVHDALTLSLIHI